MIILYNIQSIKYTTVYNKDCHMNDSYFLNLLVRCSMTVPGNLYYIIL